MGSIEWLDDVTIERDRLKRLLVEFVGFTSARLLGYNKRLAQRRAMSSAGASGLTLGDKFLDAKAREAKRLLVAAARFDIYAANRRTNEQDGR